MAARMRMVMPILAFLITAGAAVPSDPSPHPSGWGDPFRAVRHLNIWYNGHSQPLERFARETLQFITGSGQLGRTDPVETLLAIMAEPPRWEYQPIIWVPSRSVQKALGLTRAGTREARIRVSMKDVLDSEQLIQRVPGILEKQQRGEPLMALERETLGVYRRLVLLRALVQQEVYLVPPHKAMGHAWAPILRPDGYSWEQQISLKKAWSSFLTAVREGQAVQIELTAERFVAALHNLSGMEDLSSSQAKFDGRGHDVGPPGITRWKSLMFLSTFLGFLLALLGLRWFVRRRPYFA